MTKDELIYSVRNDSFKTLVPISSIKNTRYVKMLQKKGYNIDMTCSQFQAEHPTLDASKILIGNSVGGACYYWDPNSCVVFPIHIIGPKLVPLSPPGKSMTLEDYVEQGIRALSKDVEAKHFSFVYTALSDRMRMEYMLHIVRKLPYPGLYTDFFNAYSLGEYGCEGIGVDGMRDVIALKTSEEVAKTQAAIKDLPEVVTIYRGEGDKSISWERAFSWSIDPKIAGFFAVWHGDKWARIHTAKVKKTDIQEYLDDRNESEVIVLPDDVFDVETQELYGLDWLEKAMPKAAELFNLVKQTHRYEEIQFLKDSKVHGRLHSLRVLFLCVIMLEMRSYKDVTEELRDLTILTEAALYHDVGRMHDWEDRDHGSRSADIYLEQTEGANPIIPFLMRYHCRPDKDGYAYIEAHPEEFEDQGHAKQLFDIFKDADGLDRVRLGSKDLDFTQLRTPEAKRLPLIAKLTFESLEDSLD